MAKRHEAIQEQLSEHLQEQFALNAKESLLILDDVLLNLEGMASDWVDKRGEECPPEWCAERIISALETAAEHLRCESLIAIARCLREAPEDDRADPAIMRPLLEFLAEAREVMPLVEHE